jgi:hypothetical protein
MHNGRMQYAHYGFKIISEIKLIEKKN